MPARAKAKSQPAKPASKLGSLPEWNLADLYPGMDSPELKADLARGEAECVAFEQAFKGKLAGMAAGEGAGRALAEAVRRFEALDDVLGRIGSYAQLVYAGNTTDPRNAKFYGDIQERLTTDRKST